MNKNIRSIALLAALAFVLVLGVMAQQISSDKAVDPVCGMTVVKANARATFDYKGTTYYFCSTGCKEAFAKEPEKYLAKAKGEGAMAGQMGPMGQMGQKMQMGGQQAGPMGMMKHRSMEGCPMMGGPMGPMGMMQRRGMMAPGMGQLFMMYGDKIEMAVENTKDGAVLKITSKDPEVVKAIQVHMAEHMAMMKKMREAQAKTPAAPIAR